MATVKGEIVTFLGTLNAAVNAQGGKGSSIDNAIVLLDTTIVNSSFALLTVYGGLMVKYYQTPTAINNYLPVDLLHRVPQDFFTITLVDLLPHFIAKRKFNITKETISVTNSSTSTAVMYFTNGIATTPTIDELVVTIAPESTATFNPTLMGYTDTNRYLYIVSNDGLSTLIEVTFL